MEQYSTLAGAYDTLNYGCDYGALAEYLAKEIKDKRLDEIAALLRQKVPQAEIARRLEIPKSTMSDRCKIIRTKYPHLLEEPQVPDDIAGLCPDDDNCENNSHNIFTIESVRASGV